MIALSPVFAERGVRLRLGVIRGRIDPSLDTENLDEALAQAVEGARARIKERKISEWPAIAAGRQAYKACGKDPSRYRLSSEALLRRIASDKDLYRVNHVVDVGTLISIETGFPVGCYDEAQLAPPVEARIGGERESYGGIGRGPINLEGLPLLADGQGPFGSPTSDSERTKITEASRSVSMVLFGFGEAAGLAAAVERAAELLQAHARVQMSE
ncbi:MAG: B3/4 domain-containing protein [Geminicoccaceae bacterium]